MSGLNPGTVGATVSLTKDQLQARRLGIHISTREVKSLDTPCRQRTNTACCFFSSLELLQSAIANIPHQGYQKPVLQFAFANIPHRIYHKPMLQFVFANKLT
ncbi:hypothetical protein PoB_002667100 [Plakobranchus ocellatus]|uniref:Uncharacterized protein n=1 Tax=Plakobranchus ocellatus TaxID=259542 RepID=A0AAV4A073_9GAST|nr:hypothetical protein PoB_002667100 [Plakobranchus ocellatus]